MKAVPVAFALSALLFASTSTTAQMRDPDAALKRMHTVLSVFNQELTATSEQVKALHAARSANDCSSLNVVVRSKVVYVFSASFTLRQPLL